MADDKKKSGRIGVLMGGLSSERKISLKSGQAVLSALLRNGCDVVPLDIVDKSKDKISSFILDAKINVAFIALHGRFGEDGGIQAILEELNIPYTGSGVEASRVAMNKVSTQELLKKNGICVPQFTGVSKGPKIDIKQIVRAVGAFPYVVKPAQEGSSIGVVFVNDEKGLEAALEEAWKYGDQAIVEQCISNGRELTVGILGDKALPVIEIRPKSGYFDFTAKYQKGMTEYIIPAEIPQKVALEIQSTAEAVHRTVGCRDLSRIDFILDKNNKPYVLEINTIPGFTETSLLPKAALKTGVDFDQLCLKLIGSAYGKKTENQNISCGL